MATVSRFHMLGIAGLFSGIALLAALSHSLSQPAHAFGNIDKLPAVTRTDLQKAFAASGIEPESLAAAGLSGNRAIAVVTNARTYLTDHLAELNQALKDAIEAAAALAKASRDNPQAFAELQAANTWAKASRDAALLAFSNAALSELSEGERKTVANIRANRAQSLPLKYLVVNRTDSEWAELRNALAAERTAADRREPVSQPVQSILEIANSNTSVAAAAAALESQATTVRSAWATALRE